MTSCSGKKQPRILEETGIDAPEWFVNVPKDPNYLYAAASARSKYLQMSINEAKEEALVDIARQIEVKAQSLFKRLREEVGLGEDAEFLSQITDVSKSVTSEILRGLQAKKTKPM